MNQFKTFILMLILTGILMYIGSFYGKEGMIIALGISVLTNFITYFFSDKIVLAQYQAQDVPENSRLYRIVDNLAKRDGIPTPRVCVVEESSPNAFATGRDPNHAAVCATTGILNILNDDELEGVIAHELSHVKHRDILVSTICAGMCGAITLIFRFAFIFLGSRDRNGGCGTIIGLLIGSLAATIIQLWISRTREYMADKSGAELCGKPWALANALEKLALGIEQNPMTQSTPETRNMFILNPVSIAANLFSTHPPIEDRIKKLRSM